MNIKIKSWHDKFWHIPKRELGTFAFILANQEFKNEEFSCRVVVTEDPTFCDARLDRGVFYIPSSVEDVRYEIEKVLQWLESLKFETEQDMHSFLKFQFHWEYEQNWPFYIRSNHSEE